MILVCDKPSLRKRFRRKAVLTALVWVFVLHSFSQLPIDDLAFWNEFAEEPRRCLDNEVIVENLTKCDFPPTLKTCDVSALWFEPSKMHKTADPVMFVPNHTLKIAYGPWLTKCGSTTTISMMKYFANDRSAIYPTENHTFITFIRHPLERALSGYFQMEAFLRRGWIDELVEEFNLTWWNSSCINSTWIGVEKDQKYQCTATAPSRTIMARLSRLHAFLNDLQQKGFIDQHITPLTYLMANASVFIDPNKLLLFDLKDIKGVFWALSKAYNKEYRRGHSRKRELTLDPDNPKAPHWQVRWSEIVEWSETIPLAKTVMQQLCTLYRHDVECLPFEIPECGYDY